MKFRQFVFLLRRVSACARRTHQIAAFFCPVSLLSIQRRNRHASEERSSRSIFPGLSGAILGSRNPNCISLCDNAVRLNARVKTVSLFDDSPQRGGDSAAIKSHYLHIIASPVAQKPPRDCSPSIMDGSFEIEHRSKYRSLGEVA